MASELALSTDDRDQLAALAVSERRPDLLSAAGLIVVGVCAVTVSAGALYELARYAGWDAWTAPALPAIISVHAITTVRILMSARTRSACVRTAARRQATAAIAAELVGNGLSHLLQAGVVTLGTWRWLLVLAVALVAPAAVGGLVHLVSLRGRDDEFARAEDRTVSVAETNRMETEPTGTGDQRAVGTVPRPVGTVETTVETTTAIAAETAETSAETTRRTTSGTTETTPETTRTGSGSTRKPSAGTGSRRGPRAVSPRTTRRSEDRTGNHHKNGNRAFDPVLRADARAMYRASVNANERMSERALAAEFELSKTWARNRIKEVETGAEITPPPAAVARTKPAPPARRTAGDLAADVRAEAEAPAAYRASVDRGEPLTVGALAECYGRTREWAQRIIDDANGEQQAAEPETVRTTPNAVAPYVRHEAAG